LIAGTNSTGICAIIGHGGAEIGLPAAMRLTTPPPKRSRPRRPCQSIRVLLHERMTASTAAIMFSRSVFGAAARPILIGPCRRTDRRSSASAR
jgi:hypothetical protein